MRVSCSFRLRFCDKPGDLPFAQPPNVALFITPFTDHHVFGSVLSSPSSDPPDLSVLANERVGIVQFMHHAFTKDEEKTREKSLRDSKRKDDQVAD